MIIIFIGKTNYLGGFDIYHEIKWGADEDFEELIKFKAIPISETTAEKIEDTSQRCGWCSYSVPDG